MIKLPRIGIIRLTTLVNKEMQRLLVVINWILIVNLGANYI